MRIERHCREQSTGQFVARHVPMVGFLLRGHRLAADKHPQLGAKSLSEVAVCNSWCGDVGLGAKYCIVERHR